MMQLNNIMNWAEEMNEHYELNDANTPSSANNQSKEFYNKILKDLKALSEAIISIDGNLIQYIDNPSEELMLSAVKQNGMAIKYILPVKQTEEIKMEAIKSNPCCFEYVYEPTIPMWLSAILTNIDPDDIKEGKDPVRLIKDSKLTQYEKTLLYTSFLDKYPGSIDDISDDLNGYPDEMEIYKFLYTRHKDVHASKYPDRIISLIIDDVLKENPMFLLGCSMDYWTFPRVKLLMEYDPCAVDMACKTYIDKHNYAEIPFIIKTALDNCKNDQEIMDVVLFTSSIIRECNIDRYPILESKNILKALANIISFWVYDGKDAEMILNRFKPNDIFEYVPKAILVEHLFPKLSTFKRLKYEHKLKRYLNQPKLITTLMKELTHKPKIHGVSLNGKDDNNE